jgi:hypothetical protein
MAVGEWDQRQLCPDGGCIGVIGPDGTCKTCGRVAPNWGDERNRGLLDPEADAARDAARDAANEDADDAIGGVAADGDDDHDDDDHDDDDDDDGDADDDGDDEPEDGDGDGEHRVAGGSAGGGEWTSRALCPDGGCLGVIGDDGHCKVCGRTGVEPAHAVDPADAAEPHDKGAS